MRDLVGDYAVPFIFWMASVDMIWNCTMSLWALLMAVPLTAIAIDHTRFIVRLRRGRRELELLEQSPAYCVIHQHHKWCEHNGGVLGATGYEAPVLEREA